jgi:uncharacterized damage-inducible protein DinB
MRADMNRSTVEKITRRDLGRQGFFAAAGAALATLGVGDASAQTPTPAANQTNQQQEGRGARFNYTGEFLEELRMSRTYTLEVARAMPDTLYRFQPVPGVRSFGQQLIHLADALAGNFEVLIQEKAKPTVAFSEAGKEDVKTKQDVVTRVSAAYDLVENAMQKVRNSDLRNDVKMPRGGSYSKHRVLRLLLDHTTHHRAMAVLYLRLCGLTPPEYRA